MEISSRNSGFTLMELVIVSSLMVVVAGLSITMFREISIKQQVEKDTEEAYALINRARNLTIAGEEGSEFGVHFATTTIIMFKGKTYMPGDSDNEVYVFRNSSTVSNISLTGGVSQIYFSKVYGRPNATGTVEIQSSKKSTLKERMTIYGSGLTEIQ